MVFWSNKRLMIGPEPWNSELRNNSCVCYVVTRSTSPPGKYWAPSPAFIHWKSLFTNHKKLWFTKISRVRSFAVLHYQLIITIDIMDFVKTLIFISESWNMRNYVMRSNLEKEGSNTTCRCGVRRSKCVEVMHAHALVWGMLFVETSFSSGKHGCTFY